MDSYRIIRFEGRPDITCASEVELAWSLESMSKDAFDYPVLVNVHADGDRGAIIGLGIAVSTLQLVDTGQGVTHRAVSNNKAVDDVEFLYQGEATFVAPRYLVPQDLAIQALVDWLATDKLSGSLEWSSAPWPPRLS
jgi:hypothetical protein